VSAVIESRRSLYFEDFHLGRSFRTAGRTVTEADVVAFAGLSGDFSSLHMNDAYASQSRFGGRIAHGLCGVTIVSGLFVQLGLWDDTAVAILSTAWEFKAPIFLGDTIHAEITVTEARETRHLDRGIVRFRIEVPNQSGTVTQLGDWVQMFARRPREA
jgi:acyl dehydratase